MARRLIHQGYLYESPEELANVMAPQVRAGLERGDAVLAAMQRPCVDALAAELGAAATQVELYDTGQWYPRPFDRLQAVDRRLRELPEGGELLALGEPVWSGSDAVRREWARYESVINVALADAPLRFVCLYDATSLPESILDHGRRTHGELLLDGTPCPCDVFVEPERYVPALRPEEGDPSSADELPLTSDQHAFRVALAGVARARGLAAERVDELVLAAGEVATNALVHGQPPLRVRVWNADGELVCEVADSGQGRVDPLVGWRLPDPAANGGWGLPLSRQLCDALEILSDADGVRVRLHIALAKAGSTA
jgi:anti-sigma regulatory factor (Ser/Thr protein kinase)